MTQKSWIRIIASAWPNMAERIIRAYLLIQLKNNEYLYLRLIRCHQSLTTQKKIIRSSDHPIISFSFLKCNSATQRIPQGSTPPNPPKGHGFVSPVAPCLESTLLAQASPPRLVTAPPTGCKWSSKINGWSGIHMKQKQLVQQTWFWSGIWCAIDNLLII